MLWPTYEKNIANLENYHKKNLNQEQHDLYFRMLQNMDDNAFPDVLEKWIRGNKPMPGQFPTVNDLLALYYTWQHDHPEVIEKGIKIACKDCFGKGWLWFRHPELNRQGAVADPDPPDPNAVRVYESIAGCAKCKGFRIDAGPVRNVPAYTREELEARGYSVWPYSEMIGCGDKFRKGNKSAKALAEKLAATFNYDDDIPF